MRPILFLSLFLGLMLPRTLPAEHVLVFTNKPGGKEVMVSIGDLVKFSYKGYIGQQEQTYGMVTHINDSLVEITLPSQDKRRLGAMDMRYIYIRDITGFRKFHRSKPYLSLLANVVTAAGTICLFYAIDQHTNLSFAEKFGISAGAGLVSTGVVRLLFPERIKNRIGPEAWEVKTMKTI